MYIRFERVERPYSYNDSVITNLSWMRSEPSTSSSSSLPQTNNNNNNNNFSSSIEQQLLQQQQQHQQSQEHFYGHYVPPSIFETLNESNVLEYSNDSAKDSDTGSQRSENTLSDFELVKSDGWLAVGNLRGLIGVTFTSIYPNYKFEKDEVAFHYARMFANSATPTTSAWAQSPKDYDYHGGHPLHAYSNPLVSPEESMPPPLSPVALFEPPQRSNYNLRGHRTEIMLVRWNEPYQKLATCDKSGVIFVWIKYEGRWSIELINDRNTRVTDFAWSHDGRLALICYMDGFALVGSVTGQRYWSSMLNLNDCTITCGVWTPNDQQVLFGTSNGHIIVLSSAGTYLTQVCVQECIEITNIVYSCKKFHTPPPAAATTSTTNMPNNNNNGSMEHLQHNHNHGHNHAHVRHNHATEANNNNNNNPGAPPVDHNLPPSINNSNFPTYPNIDNSQYTVAITFVNGTVYFMRTFDDIFPNIVQTELMSIKIDWSDESQLFLVGGHRMCQCRSSSSVDYSNIISFYNSQGEQQKTLELEYDKNPITALCFGNVGRRIFVACGPLLLVGWVILGFPKLSMMTGFKIESALSHRSSLGQLPIPDRMLSSLSRLFNKTIFAYLPDCNRLREFVLRPPKPGIRLYCTLLRHSCPNNSDEVYVLYLEYMGGMVPLLKGKRCSKMKPEFVIFDPEPTPGAADGVDAGKAKNKHSKACVRVPESSDSDNDMSMTPRTHRRLMLFSRPREERNSTVSMHSTTGVVPNDAANSERSHRHKRGGRGSFCAYDTLPEDAKMIQISSNIWGTKFKFHSLMPSRIPPNLGSVRYRTSLLHLQPRQMSLMIKELNETNTFPYNSLDVPSEFDNMEEGWNGQTYLNYQHGLYSSQTSDSEDEDSVMESAPCPAIVPIKKLECVRNSMLIHAEIVPPPPPSLESDDNLASMAELSPPPPIVQPESPLDTFESRLTRECSSIAEQLATLNDELLTLQVGNQPEPSYNLELCMPTTSKQREPNKPAREPEIVQLLSPDANEPIPQATTFVKQFKHQTFQSESPKHVSHYRQHHKCPRSSSSSNSAKSVSPTQSPNRNTLKKATKESPRKSSVSYCQTEFSAKSFLENNAEEVEGASAKVSNTEAPPNSPIKVTQYKTCSQEAFVASAKLSLLQPKEITAGLCVTSPIVLTKPTALAAKEPLDMSAEKMISTTLQNRRLAFKNNSKQSKSLELALVATEVGFVNNLSEGNSHSFNSCFNVSSSSSSGTSTSTNVPNEEKTPEANSNKLESCKHLDNVEEIVNQMSTRIAQSSMSGETSTAKLSQAHTNHELIRRNSLSLIEVHVGEGSSARTARDSMKPRKLRHADEDEIQSINSSMESLAMESTTAKRGNAKFREPKGISSLPNTPLQPRKHRKLGESRGEGKRKSLGKFMFHSPGVIRKMKQRLSYLDCSSEDETQDDDDESEPSVSETCPPPSAIKHSKPRSKSVCNTATNTPKKAETMSPSRKLFTKYGHFQSCTARAQQQQRYRRDTDGNQYRLRNKAPLWNEVSQVYQLDFGGRVTQESAKNFQIEYQDKQVMQFGRIDANAYTLDFEYPFSVAQALCIALANVTQRLK